MELEQAKEMIGKTYEVLVESFENGTLYGSLDSGKTISFAGPENAVGEFLEVKVVSSRKSVIYGEIVDVQKANDAKPKHFKLPLEVSILPKDEKNMKLLRENKKNKKVQNDDKSRN